MAINHYENFPVASILLPKPLRRPIHVIYQFAREADDIADEGNIPDQERLTQLDQFRFELHLIEQGKPTQNPLFQQLGEIIKEYHLPLQLFFDLLDAFSQDVVKKRYANFVELMDYCRRSANPIGRLLLHLYQANTTVNLAQSDLICSTLQLINFWQDIAIDWQKDRVYLPQDELIQYQVTEQQIAHAKVNDNWQTLLEFQINRSRKMLESGAPLGHTLPGRIGLELRMIVQGGLCILDKLEKVRGDVFNHRPVLNSVDWIFMFFKSLR